MTRITHLAKACAQDWDEMWTHASLRSWEALALNTLMTMRADLLGLEASASLSPTTYICGYTDRRPVLIFVPVLTNSKEEHRQLIRQALVECGGTGLIFGACGHTVTLDNVTQEPCGPVERIVFVSIFHTAYPFWHSKIVACAVQTEYGRITGFSVPKWEDPQPDTGAVADCFWNTQQVKLVPADATVN